MHFCIRDEVIEHVEKMLRTKNHDRIPFTKLSIICGAVGFLAFVTQLLTYIFVEMTIREVDEARYLANMILTPSCKKYADTNLKFNEKSIVISGLGLLGIGAYFGILIQAKYFPNTYWLHIQNTSWRKTWLRLPVAILLILPFGVINLVVPSTAKLGLMIAFSTNIPCLGMFICLFAFSDVLNAKFKLVNEDVSPSIPIKRAKDV